MARTTIDLQFTPEDVRSGTAHEKAKQARIDAAYERVLGDPSLSDVRAKLSVDKLRRLISALID